MHELTPKELELLRELVSQHVARHTKFPHGAREVFMSYPDVCDLGTKLDAMIHGDA